LLFGWNDHRNRGEAFHFSGNNLHLCKRREFVRALHTLETSSLKLRCTQRRNDDELERVGQWGPIDHRFSPSLTLLPRSIDATVGSGVPLATITNATTVALVTSIAMRKMMDMASPLDG
jgi:hypothetical protein